MQNSTLLILIYVLITLIVWLIGLRLFKKELFVNSSNEIGASIFIGGIIWPIWLWFMLINNCGPLSSKLLKKMNDIKF